VPQADPAVRGKRYPVEHPQQPILDGLVSGIAPRVFASVPTVFALLSKFQGLQRRPNGRIIRPYSSGIVCVVHFVYPYGVVQICGLSPFGKSYTLGFRLSLRSHKHDHANTCLFAGKETDAWMQHLAYYLHESLEINGAG